MRAIALFGATGRIGSRILNGARARGHHVTAIVSYPERALPPSRCSSASPGTP
jgi:putative NADH-flavin reductase